ncbi:MAG: hypothetical protein XXXJIFNMEKO3_00252 [Candidatus Erwinia impunctatus]
MILDDKFVVTSFRQHSLNRSLFEYLYHNPGRVIDIAELDKEVLKGRSLNLAKIGDAMGFKSELRRLLFTCEGNTIIYHPDKLADFPGLLKIN